MAPALSQLDYATSGVMCVALNKKAANAARVLFEGRNVKKCYLALVRPPTAILGMGQEALPRTCSQCNFNQATSTWTRPPNSACGSKASTEPPTPCPARYAHSCIPVRAALTWSQGVSPPSLDGRIAVAKNEDGGGRGGAAWAAAAWAAAAWACRVWSFSALEGF